MGLEEGVEQGWAEVDTFLQDERSEKKPALATVRRWKNVPVEENMWMGWRQEREGGGVESSGWRHNQGPH